MKLDARDRSRVCYAPMRTHEKYPYNVDERRNGLLRNGALVLMHRIHRIAYMLSQVNRMCVPFTQPTP